MVVKSIGSENRMLGFKSKLLPLTSCVTLRDLFKLSKPVSPHRQIEADENRTQLARLLCGLSEWIHVEHLDQYLVPYKYQLLSALRCQAWY